VSCMRSPLEMKLTELLVQRTRIHSSPLPVPPLTNLAAVPIGARFASLISVVPTVRASSCTHLFVAQSLMARVWMQLREFYPL
jgi:hypothetical protein